MKFSPRYAWPVAVLLLIALVPTVSNVYMAPAPLEAGTLDSRIPTQVEGIGNAGEGTRDAAWAKRLFGADDYVSRQYGDIHLFAARNYDAKKLFHFPELGVDYGRNVTQRRLETLPSGLPVRVLEFETSRGTTLSAYVLLYGDRPVRDPVPFLAATLPERFVGKREPMTLVYVRSGADAADLAPAETRLMTLLDAACTELLR